MDATQVARRALWHPGEHRPTAGVRLGIGALVLMVGVVTLSLLGAAASDALGVATESLPLAVIGVGSLAVVVGLARFVDRRTIVDYGLGLDSRWVADCAFGLALGAVLQTGILVVGVTGGWFRVDDVAVLGPLLPDLTRAAALFVVVGVLEEILVRGWLLTNLAEGLRFIGERAAVLGAVLLSAAAFGLGHANNPEASVASTGIIVCAGVFLGAGYVLTGELGLPIGLHIAWNFFQGPVYGFGVSGFDFGPAVLAADPTGPAWLTGGAFGPEAGLLGLLALLAGTPLLAGWVRWYHGPVAICPDIATPDLRDGSDADGASASDSERTT